MAWRATAWRSTRRACCRRRKQTEAHGNRIITNPLSRRPLAAMSRGWFPWAPVDRAQIPSVVAASRGTDRGAARNRRRDLSRRFVSLRPARSHAPRAWQARSHTSWLTDVAVVAEALPALAPPARKHRPSPGNRLLVLIISSPIGPRSRIRIERDSPQLRDRRRNSRPARTLDDLAFDYTSMNALWTCSSHMSARSRTTREFRTRRLSRSPSGPCRCALPP